MRIRHAYSGFIYESMDDGNVSVKDPKTGDAGVFTRDAVWISGSLKSGDHHMIGHVGGKTAEGATSLGEFFNRRR
ncbi:MAG: transposase [bacterium]